MAVFEFGPLSRWRSHPLVRRFSGTPLIAAGLIAGASLAYVIWGGSSAESLDPRIVSVTSLPGLEYSPSISPDGNFVVFSWTGQNPEGIPDLWIKAVDRDSLQPLTGTPTAAETSAAWSPNGRDIAFIRVGEGVFTVPALGGAETKVTDSGSMVAWMPDGRSLLVRDGQPAAGTPYGIFQIELETFTRTQLTRAPTGIGDSTFDVAPDGRSLAFVRYERPGIGDVYVAPITGGEARRRTNWNSRDQRCGVDSGRTRYRVLRPRRAWPRRDAVPDSSQREVDSSVASRRFM